jgi:hypothetical protein
VQFILLGEGIKNSSFPLFTGYVSHYGIETGFNEWKRKTITTV